jgi:hypothetical protein
MIIIIGVVVGCRDASDAWMQAVSIISRTFGRRSWFFGGIFQDY